MVDIIGPADAVGAVTVRPPDDRTFGAYDSWIADCTSELNEDGTDITASFLNGMIALLRSAWRANGKLADNVTPVVPEIGSGDDGLTRAMQYMVQRGQHNFSGDAGTTNHIVAGLFPPLREYKAGLLVMIGTANANTGPSDININGLGAKQILRRDGSQLQAGDMLGGGSMVLLGYDGLQFEMLSHIFERPTLTAARTYYVKAAAPGSDANDGLTTATPFATWQKAIDTIKKLNTNGWPVKVKGLGGTYGAGATASGPFFGGGTVTLEGSGPGSFDNIVVASGSAFQSIYGAELNVGTGFTLQSNDASNGALTAQFGGLMNLVGDVHFNACTGYHMMGDAQGQIRIRSNYFIDGAAAAHIVATGQGRVAKDTAGTIAVGIANGLNFANGFAYARSLGFISLPNFVWGGSSITGPRYMSALNGVIDTNGGGASYFPGNASGSTSQGGQYN